MDLIRMQIDETERFPLELVAIYHPLLPNLDVQDVWPEGQPITAYSVGVSEESHLAVFLKPELIPQDVNSPSVAESNPRAEFERSQNERGTNYLCIFSPELIEKFNFFLFKPISSWDSESSRRLTDYCPQEGFPADRAEVRILNNQEPPKNIVTWMPLSSDSEGELESRLKKLNAFIQSSKAAALSRQVKLIRLEETAFAQISGTPKLQVDYEQRVNEWLGLSQKKNQELDVK
jgi:hypothetical protein